jgi:acetyl-CoA carboxylase alpha subunit
MTQGGALLAFIGEGNLPADYLFVDFWELAGQRSYVFDYQVAGGLAHLAEVVVAGFVDGDAEGEDAG